MWTRVVEFWRDVDDRKCAYHNGCDWIRSVVTGMGLGSTGLDRRPNCSCWFRCYHSFHFGSSGWFLQNSLYRNEKHLLQRCCQKQLGSVSFSRFLFFMWFFQITYLPSLHCFNKFETEFKCIYYISAIYGYSYYILIYYLTELWYIK